MRWLLCQVAGSCPRVAEEKSLTHLYILGLERDPVDQRIEDKGRGHAPMLQWVGWSCGSSHKVHRTVAFALLNQIPFSMGCIAWAQVRIPAMFVARSTHREAPRVRSGRRDLGAQVRFRSGKRDLTRPFAAAITKGKYSKPRGDTLVQIWRTGRIGTAESYAIEVTR